MFRAEIAAQTDLGERVKDVMASGNLVDDETTMAVLRGRLSQKDCKGGAVLDGIPRTSRQARDLDRLLGERGAGEAVTLVIEINVPNDVITRRLTGRRFDPATGIVYHIEFKPPPPGLRVEQRPDDKAEVVAGRLLSYQRARRVLVAYYYLKHLKGETAGAIIVNGDQPIADVTAEMLAKVGKALAKPEAPPQPMQA